MPKTKAAKKDKASKSTAGVGPSDPAIVGDRVPVLEPNAQVPFRVLPPEDPKSQTKEQKTAADKARRDGEALAKQKEDANAAALKDREARGVEVVAVRTGFYPSDGRIRKPGEKFTYVPVKDAKTGKVEELLPSWMQHVDGKIESRVSGDTSPGFDDSPAAVITVKRDGSVSHASGSKVI